jgi:TetR/AcrR family transcriptional repressor of mexJK operon
MDAVTTNPDNSPRPTAGRPTREQALARALELLDRALDHFLEKGFEQATIEAIAADVGMTKRTVYALYPEKAALFLAAVQRAIERQAVSDATLHALDRGDLETTLTAFARMRVEQVMTPTGLKLQRIVNTEAYRFPEIFTMHYDQHAMPAIRFLTDLFTRETAAGRLALDDPAMAASVFMSMVVSGPVRIIVSGNRIAKIEIEERLCFAIRLFLQGAKPR